MKKPVIAVISFPGNNCEFESLRAIEQSGMEARYHKWNDDRAQLKDVDGYFLVGGFSYEDRGRSGMVAARDPLLDFIGQEAEEGKVVIGNCNGAQILVESGMIPLDEGLRMSLARNTIENEGKNMLPGFLSQWVWITPSVYQSRCCTSHWKGVMHLPIAHGEGRFTTNDREVLKSLKENSQIAFSYCDSEGHVSDDPSITPNGSMFAAAGICNPAGNVVALMPHPERTPHGKPYFDSLRLWIESVGRTKRAQRTHRSEDTLSLKHLTPLNTELYIDTIIVNNEERTIEQTAKTFAPSLRLKQWKYFGASSMNVEQLLSDLTIFNANKERAIIRRGAYFFRWSAKTKREEPLSAEEVKQLFDGYKLLRRDMPDTVGRQLSNDGVSGICYVCSGIPSERVNDRQLMSVFANPHASELFAIS